MSNSWNKNSKRNHDLTIYTFKHADHGIETCTRSALCKKYSINQKRIWAIVHKYQKTALGWSIVWENEANT